MGHRAHVRMTTESNLFRAADAMFLKRTRHITSPAMSSGRLHRRLRRLEVSASPAGLSSSLEMKRSRVMHR